MGSSLGVYISDEVRVLLKERSARDKITMGQILVRSFLATVPVQKRPATSSKGSQSLLISTAWSGLSDDNKQKLLDYMAKAAGVKHAELTEESATALYLKLSQANQASVRAMLRIISEAN